MEHFSYLLAKSYITLDVYTKTCDECCLSCTRFVVVFLDPSKTECLIGSSRPPIRPTALAYPYGKIALIDL